MIVVDVTRANPLPNETKSLPEVDVRSVVGAFRSSWPLTRQFDHFSRKVIEETGLDGDFLLPQFGGFADRELDNLRPVLHLSQ